MVQEPATSKPTSRLSSPGIMYNYLKFIYIYIIYIMYYFRNQPWLGSKCRLLTCPPHVPAGGAATGGGTKEEGDSFVVTGL
jgi:hypothetical protein